MYQITASTTFRAIGTEHRISVTEPSVLPKAVAIAKHHLAHLDLAASRFRFDSEVMTLSRLTPTHSDGTVTATVSPLLATYLAEALEAARWTGGLVDPTVGTTLSAAGYDADIASVRSRPTFTRILAAPTISWRDVTLNDDRLRMPAGTVLDLGATAKARAADVVATVLGQRLPGGFLVCLGGDCAVSGDAPAGGWAVAVSRHDGSVAQLVTTAGAALATSSTQHRTWPTDHGRAHHILNPATGEPADAVWSAVTCVAGSAVLANAASTAAVVLGDDAPGWLARRGLAARLESQDGSVVTTAGWPTETAPPPSTSIRLRQPVQRELVHA